MKYLGAVSTRAAQSASGSNGLLRGWFSPVSVGLRTGGGPLGRCPTSLKKQPRACGWPSTDVAGIHSSWAEVNRPLPRTPSVRRFPAPLTDGFSSRLKAAISRMRTVRTVRDFRVRIAAMKLAGEGSLRAFVSRERICCTGVAPREDARTIQARGRGQPDRRYS